MNDILLFIRDFRARYVRYDYHEELCPRDGSLGRDDMNWRVREQQTITFIHRTSMISGKLC